MTNKQKNPRITEVLGLLDQGKPGNIDSLATAVQRLCIADGIVVREAIRWRLSHLGGRTDKKLIAPNDAYRAVRECMMAFGDAMKQSQDKNGTAETTR